MENREGRKAHRRTLLQIVFRGLVPEYGPLLQSFHSAFERRRRYSWLAESGYGNGNLIKGLHGALKRAFAQYRTPITPQLSMGSVDPTFFRSLIDAVDQLPDGTLDMFYFLLARHDVDEQDQAKVREAVIGGLEHYVRNAECGVTADPW